MTPPKTKNAIRAEVTAPRAGPKKRHDAPYRVTTPVANLHREPYPDAPLDTQLLLGEEFLVSDTTPDGWAHGQTALDAYPGYVALQNLREGTTAATHRVHAVRTFFYAEPDLKSPLRLAAGMNAKLAVTAVRERFAQTADGLHVFAAHLAPIGETRADWVAQAELLLGMPYLWGGRDALGLDCSALVQLALEWHGVAAPRDTSEQETSLGVALPADTNALRRGDLVFWRGHVGIMRNAETMLHASAHDMAVASEPFVEAEARIRQVEGPIRCIRRL